MKSTDGSPALKFLGVKGTTGTQASFLELFDGDDAKVVELDQKGGRRIWIRGGLSGLGSDVFAKGRRPGALPPWPASPKAAIASAPICVCSRTSGRSKSRSRPSRSAPPPWLTSATRCGPSGCARWQGSRWRWLRPRSQTAATQWLERTLDDSAIRRLVIPQAFLAVDAILNLYLNIAHGLVVHPAVIARHVAEHLPFMATENLLDGGGPGRRRPPGTARADPGSLDGGFRAIEARGCPERPARPHSSRRSIPAPGFRQNTRPAAATPAARPSRSTNLSRAWSTRFAGATRSRTPSISTMRQFECNGRSNRSGPAERLELSRSGVCRL